MIFPYRLDPNAHSNHQETFPWWIRWIIPEDWRRDLEDLKIQWVDQVYTQKDIIYKTFFFVLEIQISFVLLSPFFLINLFRKINPSFVYQEYLSDYRDILEKIELEFIENHYYMTLSFYRIVIFIAVIFYAAFSFLDYWCLSSSYHLSWVIRFVICCCLLTTLGLSFRTTFFLKVNQLILCLLSIVSGGGIILMIAISQPSDLAFHTYYTGLILCFFFNYSFMALRFVYASIAGLSIFFGYEFVAIFFQNSLDFYSENFLMFINNNFFFITCNIIGMISCNSNERSIRVEFLSRYIITHKLLELYRYHEHTQPSPQELLNRINRIRKSPAEFRKFVLEAIVKCPEIHFPKQLPGNS